MKYFLVEELGSGAFGTVYRAVENNTNRVFAVKVLFQQEWPRDVAISLAYRGEGRILPKLTHVRVPRSPTTTPFC
jgi:serine/threonine protein kinase